MPLSCPWAAPGRAQLTPVLRQGRPPSPLPRDTTAPKVPSTSPGPSPGAAELGESEGIVEDPAARLLRAPFSRGAASPPRYAARATHLHAARHNMVTPPAGLSELQTPRSTDRPE